MSKLHVYLAGPMRGLPDLNFPAFHLYAKNLRATGYEVFSPAEATTPQDDIRDCMRIDLTWICDHADIVAMMPGWETSPGARAEHAMAVALGIGFMYL